MKTLRQSVDPDDMLAPPRPRLARLRLRAICRRAAPGLPAVPRARQSCSVWSRNQRLIHQPPAEARQKGEKIRSPVSRGEVSAAIPCHVARFGIFSDELPRSCIRCGSAFALLPPNRAADRCFERCASSFETKERSFVSLQRDFLWL